MLLADTKVNNLACMTILGYISAYVVVIYISVVNQDLVRWNIGVVRSNSNDNIEIVRLYVFFF